MYLIQYEENEDPLVECRTWKGVLKKLEELKKRKINHKTVRIYQVTDKKRVKIGKGEMDKETQKALEGSIKKWEKIVQRKGEDEGENNCPLCKKFIDLSGCDGCPVDMKTTDSCSGSPYGEWVDHQKEEHDSSTNPYKNQCKECQRLAKKELAFLKGLRKLKVPCWVV